MVNIKLKLESSARVMALLPCWFNSTALAAALVPLVAFSGNTTRAIVGKDPVDAGAKVVMTVGGTTTGALLVMVTDVHENQFDVDLS